MVQLHKSILESCSKFLWFITPPLIQKASRHENLDKRKSLPDLLQGTIQSWGWARDWPWGLQLEEREREAPLFGFQAAQSSIQSFKDRIGGICLIETQTKVRSMHPGR